MLTVSQNMSGKQKRAKRNTLSYLRALKKSFSLEIYNETMRFQSAILEKSVIFHRTQLSTGVLCDTLHRLRTFFVGILVLYTDITIDHTH